MMLTHLMDDIHGGGTLEVTALAAKYGTTPELIRAMLGHLERLGVVAAYTDCTGGCNGCALSDGCERKASVNLWKSSSGGG